MIKRALHGRGVGAVLSLALVLALAAVVLGQMPKTIDIGGGDQNVTIFGEDPEDLLGIYEAATGDFNGDGIMDILVGANHADGPNENRKEAGEAYVVFGEPGLPAQIDISGAAGRQPDIRIYGEDGKATGKYSPLLQWFVRGDGMGEVVTTGDLNNDGFDDLIITAALADGPRNLRPDSGEVYIFFGRSKQSWDSMRRSPGDPVIFDVAGQQGPKPDVIIYGIDEADVLMGSSTGDVNNDGIDDLLMAAGHADSEHNMNPDAGEAYVIFGKPTGSWSSMIDLSTRPGDVIFYGGHPGDQLRWAASAMGSRHRSGDLNGDGMDDIVLVASHASFGGTVLDAGEVYLFFGRTTWNPIIHVWQSHIGYNADVTFYGADPNDTLGYYLGVGVVSLADINDDGIDDLLIGAPSAAGPGNGRQAGGEVYVVLGRHQWWPPGPPWQPARIDRAADTTIYGAAPGDKLGTSIATGDVSGNGINDVLIGAPFALGSGNKGAGSGQAYVLYGQQSWALTIDLSKTSADVTVYGADASDELGTYAITTGDVNGDQVGDILLGSLMADGPQNGRQNAGEAYVIFGPQ